MAKSHELRKRRLAKAFPARHNGKKKKIKATDEKTTRGRILLCLGSHEGKPSDLEIRGLTGRIAFSTAPMPTVTVLRIEYRG